MVQHHSPALRILVRKLNGICSPTWAQENVTPHEQSTNRSKSHAIGIGLIKNVAYMNEGSLFGREHRRLSHSDVAIWSVAPVLPGSSRRPGRPSGRSGHRDRS